MPNDPLRIPAPVCPICGETVGRGAADAHLLACGASESARKIGQMRVAEVCRTVEANQLEAQSIAKLEALVRHGYHSLDLIVRKDARDYHFDLDWLVRLFR